MVLEDIFLGMLKNYSAKTRSIFNNNLFMLIDRMSQKIHVDPKHIAIASNLYDVLNVIFKVYNIDKKKIAFLPTFDDDVLSFARDNNIEFKSPNNLKGLDYVFNFDFFGSLHSIDNNARIISIKTNPLRLNYDSKHFIEIYNFTWQSYLPVSDCVFIATPKEAFIHDLFPIFAGGFARDGERIDICKLNLPSIVAQAQMLYFFDRYESVSEYARFVYNTFISMTGKKPLFYHGYFGIEMENETEMWKKIDIAQYLKFVKYPKDFIDFCKKLKIGYFPKEAPFIQFEKLIMEVSK